MTRRLFVLAAALAAWLAFAAAAQAAGFTRTDAVVTMDDGVGIATSLYVPDGAAPTGGWPALMLFHGLGGNRGSMNPVAEQVFAPEGYVVLTFDARAHGESGGLFTLDGPREMADVRALHGLLADRPDVDGTRVGAWGVSYGGGAIWRATVEGVPFAAIAPTITWTDLYAALAPQDLPKTGAIFQFSQSVPRERFTAELAALLTDALSLRNLPAIRAFLGERSTLARLASVRVPTFVLQSRTDFAFDIEQGFSAFARVAGPKRLYIGNLGHAPAKNPAEERPYYLAQVRLWFDRFLKGLPNGIDTRPPVELAPDPWSERTRSYAGRPPTRTLRYTLGGRSTIRGAGKAVRTVRTRTAKLETFGSPTLTVTAPSRSRWTHLVAVLTALTPDGRELVVSEGGTSRLGRRFTIRMISVASAIPRGSRLRVTLAATSTAQNPGNLLYLIGVSPQARISVGPLSLTVPVLRAPVSP